MSKFSTGFRNAVAVDGSVRQVLALGFLKQYAGPVPATADAALGAAVLLRTISLNGTSTGLSMDTEAVDGAVTKAPSEVWSGTAVASGTMTFARHVLADDDGTASTTAVRVQHQVNVDWFVLPTAEVVSGAVDGVNTYSLRQPTL